MLSQEAIERARAFGERLTTVYHDLCDSGKEPPAGIEDYAMRLARLRTYGNLPGRLKPDGTAEDPIPAEDDDVAQLIGHASAYMGWSMT